MAGDVDDVYSTVAEHEWATCQSLSSGSRQSDEAQLTIDASLDPDVAVIVAAGTVAREVVARVGLEVSLEESRVVLVDRPSD